MDALLYWVGLAAVAVNALTGVLDAGRKQMDLVGALLVGVATALGGGTIRDLLLDRNVFWVADQTYLIAALGTGFATFFLARRQAVQAGCGCSDLAATTCLWFFSRASSMPARPGSVH